MTQIAVRTISLQTANKGHTFLIELSQIIVIGRDING